ncbi:hypothetical protein TWF694_003217 [Orbilia ellipsospora]|uniref:Uncharacterized protein n=1 Tax=Orbilia ellipsospora TaxID=2528407 RepID=A0AAV9X3C3_9PEZI
MVLNISLHGWPPSLEDSMPKREAPALANPSQPWRARSLAPLRQYSESPKIARSSRSIIILLRIPGLAWKCYMFLEPECTRIYVRQTRNHSSIPWNLVAFSPLLC